MNLKDIKAMFAPGAERLYMLESLSNKTELCCPVDGMMMVHYPVGSLMPKEAVDFFCQHQLIDVTIKSAKQ